jgi:hypothetical protein
MLTKYMNVTDIIKELKSDLPNLIRYAAHRQNNYRRIVLKSKAFPVIFKPLIYDSPRKNKWLVIFEAENKKATSLLKSHVTIACLFNSEKGIYVFMPSLAEPEKDEIAMFIPHFFSRYAQRTKTNLYGINLISQFFIKNPSFGFDISEKKQNGEEIYAITASCSDGVALGAVIEKGYMFKTFITSAMLKGSQIETFIQTEKFRTEIIDTSQNIT